MLDLYVWLARRLPTAFPDLPAAQEACQELGQAISACLEVLSTRHHRHHHQRAAAWETNKRRRRGSA